MTIRAALTLCVLILIAVNVWAATIYTAPFSEQYSGGATSQRADDDLSF